jgi:hypothetical protein
METLTDNTRLSTDTLYFRKIFDLYNKRKKQGASKEELETHMRHICYDLLGFKYCEEAG